MDERKVERVEIDGIELHVETVGEDAQRDSGPRTALPPRVESWRKRSLAGAVLTGFAFGLRDVFEKERDEPAIIVQVSGEPVGDLPVHAHLNDQQPNESVVTVRPWLLRQAGQQAGGSTGTGTGTGSHEPGPAAGSGPSDDPGPPAATPEQ